MEIGDNFTRSSTWLMLFNTGRTNVD